MKRAPASVPSSGSVALPAYEIVSPALYEPPVIGTLIAGTGGRLLVTVSLAALLVTDPDAFDTITRNCAPSSAACAPLSVYEDPVAPAMSAPLRCQR